MSSRGQLLWPRTVLVRFVHCVAWNVTRSLLLLSPTCEGIAQRAHTPRCFGFKSYVGGCNAEDKSLFCAVGGWSSELLPKAETPEGTVPSDGGARRRPSHCWKETAEKYVLLSLRWMIKTLPLRSDNFRPTLTQVGGTHLHQFCGPENHKLSKSLKVVLN